jgi:hypothetical protein
MSLHGPFCDTSAAIRILHFFTVGHKEYQAPKGMRFFEVIGMPVGPSPPDRVAMNEIREPAID